MLSLQALRTRRIQRRAFLASALSATAAAALTGCGNTTQTTTTISDNDILNYALNLEYLEAEYYLHAATGSGLASTDVTGTGTAGAVTGGARLSGSLSTAQQNILNEIAYDEQQHVRTLRSTLGSYAVARPAIDLTNSFNTLAAAAGIASTFNPFASFDAFLVGAFLFEDVGVTAYNGAANFITNDGVSSGVLATAAGILAVECNHAAYVRSTLTANAITYGTTAYPYFTYANQISALRATLGGGSETALVVPSSITAPSAVVAADSNAISYQRNTSQVLHIVFGTAAANTTSGLFFPSGINGLINTAA